VRSNLARKPLVLLEHALGVGAEEDADETAAVLVAAVPGDEKASDFSQALDDFVKEVVGAGRRWAELHAVLHRRLGFSLPAIAAEPAENDPALVDDDAQVVPCRLHAVADVAELFVRSARGDVLARHVDRAAAAGGAAFERQAVHGPVRLAADEIVHAGEVEALEPRRGPWADVSVGVVAVGDERRVLR